LEGLRGGEDGAQLLDLLVQFVGGVVDDEVHLLVDALLVFGEQSEELLGSHAARGILSAKIDNSGPKDL
jgi:hypothetical protein